MIRILGGVLVSVLIVSGALAASTEEHRAKRPELFHPETGLRIARQRAPTPDDVPGAVRANSQKVRQMATDGALMLDVGPALQSRFDDLDGTWLVPQDRQSLPGAVWLPEVGRGTLQPVMQRYLESNLTRLTTTPDQKIVVFCMADCWMSWNAVQRIGKLGYTNVYWFPEGTDGWLDEGWDLAPIDPVPVDID